MKTLAVFALVTMCCFGQQQKPAKAATSSSPFSCPPNDCTGWIYAPSPFAHWDEAVKDGTYTFALVDPENKWRCYVTNATEEHATIVCVKPHYVQVEGKSK